MTYFEDISIRVLLQACLLFAELISDDGPAVSAVVLRGNLAAGRCSCAHLRPESLWFIVSFRPGILFFNFRFRPSAFRNADTACLLK